MKIKLIGEDYKAYWADAETGEPVGSMFDDSMKTIVAQTNAYEPLVKALRDIIHSGVYEGHSGQCQACVAMYEIAAKALEVYGGGDKDAS